MINVSVWTSMETTREVACVRSVEIIQRGSTVTSVWPVITGPMINSGMKRMFVNVSIIYEKSTELVFR